MPDVRRISFSAASVFPAKLLKLNVLDKEKRIMPIHIQLNPTNACNFNCPICSCSNRNRSEQLSFKDIEDIMIKSVRCGCKSVTITGGGEPLLHPQINEIIKLLYDLQIKIGLVGNGSVMNTLVDDSLRKIIWFRISSTDYLAKSTDPDKWFKGIENIVKKETPIDWAFSHVLTKDANYDLLAKIINFSNIHNFTHVRIVSDLLDLNNVPSMDIVKEEMKKRNVNDSIAVYQGRKDYTKGTKRCLISLLKPVVGPDGMIYPCCGTQYALENPSRDYEKSMCMGNARDIDKIFKDQKFFDGSVCSKCYYSNYNWALEILTSDIKHKEFV